MSTEEATSRKAKKAQRDAERKKAGRKRKRDEVEEQEDGKNELKDDFIPLAGGDETTIAKTPAELSKKRKTSSKNAGQEPTTEDVSSARSAKKRRKSKSTAEQDTPSDTRPKPKSTDEVAATTDKPSKNRFILFIGNLPYGATDETITAHFKSIQPFTLRHRVDPKTKKSKGFAFLEFENFDRMKTCLKLYHHSTFDPDAVAADATGKAVEGGVKGSGDAGGGVTKGRKKKDKSRRINVELTAGGGGKGEDRKEKIKVKNARLEEERKRRREAEEKAAVRRERKQGVKKTGANAEGREGKEKVEGEGAEGGEAEGMQGVHPARLAQMKK